MKIYVSGRIKDYPGHLEHFATASRRLRNRLYQVVNPCEVDPQKENPTYEDFMRADIRELIECDAIYMLEGWERSVGARCEFHVAVLCGLEIQYELPELISRIR
jgi:hypothetical protein